MAIKTWVATYGRRRCRFSSLTTPQQGSVRLVDGKLPKRRSRHSGVPHQRVRRGVTVKWEEFLKPNDIIGRDFEIHQYEHICRGPISKIEIDGRYVYIELLWAARKSIGPDGDWKSYEITCWPVSVSNTLADTDNGGVKFDMPYNSFAIIFPKDSPNLDPTM